MTEKRFTISSDNNQNIYDREEKCYYSSIDAVKLCDLLNELSTENRQLMQKNKELFKDLLESQGSYVRLVCFVQRLGLDGDDLARFEEEIGVNDE